MSFNIQFGIMIITSLIIVVPILITRGLRGILKIISILFVVFIGLLEFSYILNYLTYFDFSESMIKPFYLSLLISIGLLMIISHQRDVVEYKFLKNTINRQ